jgi:hypothetical protein
MTREDGEIAREDDEITREVDNMTCEDGMITRRRVLVSESRENTALDIAMPSMDHPKAIAPHVGVVRATALSLRVPVANASRTAPSASFWAHRNVVRAGVAQ